MEQTVGGIKYETQAGVYRTLGALLRGLDFMLFEMENYRSVLDRRLVRSEPHFRTITPGTD